MAELFAVDVRTFSEHLRNTYESGELQRQATLRKFRTVQTEGSRESDFDRAIKRVEAGHQILDEGTQGPKAPAKPRKTN